VLSVVEVCPLDAYEYNTVVSEDHHRARMFLYYHLNFHFNFDHFLFWHHYEVSSRGCRPLFVGVMTVSSLRPMCMETLDNYRNKCAIEVVFMVANSLLRM